MANTWLVVKEPPVVPPATSEGVVAPRVSGFRLAAAFQLPPVVAPPLALVLGALFEARDGGPFSVRDLVLAIPTYLLFGAPIVAAVMVLVAAPLYVLLVRSGHLSRASVLLSAMGLAAGLAFLMFDQEGASVGLGAVVGLVCGSIFWRLVDPRNRPLAT